MNLKYAKSDPTMSGQCEGQDDSSCEFESIDLTLPLPAVFEGVDVPDHKLPAND